MLSLLMSAQSICIICQGKFHKPFKSQSNHHRSRSISGKNTSCPGLASPETAEMQAWTKRIAGSMGNTIPICSKIAVRIEFSGVGTAEESVKACVAMFNESIEDDFQSMGDWNAASRYCAEQNLACACRFGDIMELTNESLKSTLLAEKFDKSGSLDWILAGVLFVH